VTVTDTPDARPTGPEAPRWLKATLEVKEGRDPLGLQTTTQDRLTPLLLPGILELSRRARYFSFHSFLLDVYRQRHGRASRDALSSFIKAREWDYGLAVMSCPHECGSSPVGASSLRGVIARQPPYPRGESVESTNGGYGLYYRSPMAEFGVVARSGTLLGDTPIPIDVLYDNPRARALADGFAAVVADTEYVRSWMFNNDPIPLEVLVEFGRVGCLCQLAAHPAERDAVHEAIFGDPGEGASLADVTAAGTAELSALTPGLAAEQRRRSVAHFLTLVGEHPDIVDDHSVYREALWSPPTPRSSTQADIAGQWSALIAKDVWQEALCSLWTQFTQTGVEATRAGSGRGLTWDEVRNLAQGMVAGPPALDPDRPTTEVAAAISAGTIGLPGAVQGLLPQTTLENIRAGTAQLDTAASGLVALLELRRRAAERTGAGWVRCSQVSSAWQPSLAEVLRSLNEHLAQEPSVAETLWWLTSRYIFGVHERIAYSKLPEHTFRFRWEEGQVRFYDNGTDRFPLAAIRWDPLANLTYDLDLWARQKDGGARLTPRGQAFIEAVLG
jgi:hypothetical protein